MRDSCKYAAAHRTRLVLVAAPADGQEFIHQRVTPRLHIKLRVRPECSITRKGFQLLLHESRGGLLLVPRLRSEQAPLLQARDLVSCAKFIRQGEACLALDLTRRDDKKVSVSVHRHKQITRFGVEFLDPYAAGSVAT